MLRRVIHRHQALAAAALLALAPAASAQVYNWSTGTFTPGVTAPGTLGVTEVLNINNGGFKYIDTASGTVTINGTVNWNADSLYLQNTGAVVNNGLWDSKVNQTLVFNGGAPSFTNNGTFRKSGGTGNTTIDNGLSFVNNGTLDAQTGALNFSGGSTFNAGSVFTGAGRNNSSGSNTFNGSFSSSNLLLSGGNHVGNGAVVNGTVDFSGGMFKGSWSVAAGQTLNVLNGAFKYVDGATSTVTNAGIVNWNADAFYVQNGATIVNSGIWDSKIDQSLVFNGGAPVAFNNSGTFRKSGGTGNTTVGASMGFVNSGIIDAQTGNLNFAGGSTFNAGTSFTGVGVVVSAGSNSFNGNFTSTNLLLSGGTHLGGAAVLNGSAAFSGGTLAGSWTVAAGQTLTGEGGAFKYLEGTVTNRGTVAWNTTNALYLQNGGTWINEGLFVANESTALVYNGGVEPSFENAASATLRAAAGTTLTVGAKLINNGGTLDAEAGATLRYNGGGVFNSGTVFSGAGSNLSVGSNTFNGTQTSANLELQGGSHVGGGAVVSGLVHFSGGSLEGTWTLTSGSTLTSGPGAFKYLNGAGTVFTNQGTVTWGTTNPLYMQNGARFVNQGLYTALETTALANNGGAVPVFENTASGTLRATAGKTLVVGNNILVNNGGTLDAEAAATLRYDGGSVFNAGTRFIGSGRNLVSGNTAFNGAYSSTNLVLEGGTYTGTAVVASGTTAMSGGTLSGTWQVAAGHTLRGEGGAFKYLSGAGTVLDNQGTIAWTTTNPLYMQNGARLANAGTLDLQADTVMAYNGGTNPTFVNTGLIVKSAGAGTATIQSGLGFDNLGTVDVRAGTLALPANFTNNGRLQGTGTYSVSGTLTNAGTVAPGTSPGTLALTGNYAQAAAGIFSVDLESLLSHDLFNITGTAALNGTLAVRCWAACSLAVGDVVTVLDSVGNLSGTFASVVLSGFETGAFNVIYDTTLDRVQLQVTQTVTAAVPEPGSYALWLAGVAVVWRLASRRPGRRARR